MRDLTKHELRVLIRSEISILKQISEVFEFEDIERSVEELKKYCEEYEELSSR